MDARAQGVNPPARMRLGDRAKANGFVRPRASIAHARVEDFLLSHRQGAGVRWPAGIESARHAFLKRERDTRDETPRFPGVAMQGETLLSDAEMTLRLLLAAAMGAVIGFERERLLWAAGLRTHMLVCLGSCLFMLVSAFGFSEMLGRKGDVILDPSRVASQVVSGIGFIGAGTILLRGEVIKGLTTAASLWIAAAIGLAVGGGLYIAAGATTLLTLAILAGLKPLENLWHRREKIGDLVISARSGTISIDALRDVAGLRPSSVRQFIVRPGQCEGEEEITIAFSRLSSLDVDRVAEQLRKRPGVLSAERARTEGSQE